MFYNERPHFLGMNWTLIVQLLIQEEIHEYVKTHGTHALSKIWTYLCVFSTFMNIDEFLKYIRPDFATLGTFITLAFAKEHQDEGAHTVTLTGLHWHSCGNSISRRKILLWKEFGEGLGINLWERNADKEIRALHCYDAASSGCQLPVAMGHSASRIQPRSW